MKDENEICNPSRTVAGDLCTVNLEIPEGDVASKKQRSRYYKCSMDCLFND